MIAQDIITLICGIGWIGTLIVFLIQRHDSKKDKNNEVNDKLTDIDKRLTKQEKDSIRIQLLLLMFNYESKHEHELLQLAEHYFAVLKSDWYMTKMFYDFLIDNDIGIPSWFEGD